MTKYDYEKEPQGAESIFELKTDKRIKRFVESIKNLSKPLVLEIGMGQGQFLKKFSRIRPDAVLKGIDISNSAIDTINKDTKLSGEFVVGDAENIPFPDNHFDAVVIIDVLEHLEHPEKAVLEVKRVLKDDGIFHFFIPCENELYTLDWFLRKTNFLLLSEFTKVHFGHIQHLSQADVKRLVAPHFTVGSITYSGHWLSQLFHLFTLYLPKKMVSLLSKETQRQARDAYEAEQVDNFFTKVIKIAKIIWQAITFPVSIIYEAEASVLKKISFAAQGMHYTGIKKL